MARNFPDSKLVLPGKMARSFQDSNLNFSELVPALNNTESDAKSRDAQILPTPAGQRMMIERTFPGSFLIVNGAQFPLLNSTNISAKGAEIQTKVVWREISK